MTLFKMPLISPPPVELLEEEPPSKPPKTLATVEPVLLDVALLLVVALPLALLAAVEAAVEEEVVAFLVVEVVAFFFVVVFFFVVFLTGIDCDREAFSAASLMALALLPAVHASTRAAIKNTFFIAFSNTLCIVFACKYRKKMGNKEIFFLFFVPKRQKTYFLTCRRS